MSTFTKLVATTPEAAPDPTRHVNYNVGMLLGVDDFNQEFAYLSGRDQWMARDLIGYGTVSGLRVFTEADARGPRVVVEPGVALSPRGQLIRVPTAQCAYLNDWLRLDKTQDELIAHLASPPTTVRAYVVLCYRECPTEKVPIPGEPCRSEDDVMLPSRLADDFKLELVLEAPGQREEDAVRDFVSWLSQISVSNSSTSVSLEDFEDAIRAAAHLLSSPPESGAGPLPDYLYGSPPATLVINSADLCEYLDAAFRIWVTELRPRFRPDFLAGAHGCANNGNGTRPNVEECLLLAEVDVPVIVPGGGTELQVEDPDLLAVDQERRPLVVHLRMLQEMLLCGRGIEALAVGGGGGGGPVALAGDATGPTGATRVERIQGVPVAITAPAANQVLRFSAGQWRPAAIAAPPTPVNTVVAEQAFGQATSAGAAATYARSDHTHGTPPDPVPAHQADPAAHNLAGDVTGTVSTTRVAAIQNVAVNPVAPAANQVLTFTAGQWRPANPPTGGAVINPATTVAAANTFGLASVVGTSALYARADHTHGTPPDPIPAHRADPAAHNVAGDVTGALNATIVGRIRNVPVAATPAPANGQALIFRNGQWQPEAIPVSTGPTDVVEHPPGFGPYSIVAAGTVRCDGAAGFLPIYGGLRANATGTGQVTVRFSLYQPPPNTGGPGAFQYVVKVLPVFDDRFLDPVISFIRFLATPGLQGGMQLRVTVRGGQTLPADALAQLQLMIEISRFESRLVE